MMAPNKKLCLGFSAPENALSSTPPSGIHLVFLVEDVTTVLADFRHRVVPITHEITVSS